MSTLILDIPAKLLRFNSIRASTESICAPLEPEDTVVQPIVDVSPPKWHMGHTTWFFEQFVLSTTLPGYKPFHKDYSYLFNSYYNSVGNRVQRANRSTITRPPLKDIYAYRRYVNEHIEKLFDVVPDEKLESILPVLELGLQHEQQHQELLLTDIKYILSTNPLLPSYQETRTLSAASSIEPEFLEVPGGIYKIGYQGSDFCFDNELGVHEVLLADFKVMNRPVTNAEYLEFMQDGGYKDFKHWLDEGFCMVNEQHLEAPLYWYKQDGEWYRFALHGPEKINLFEPVTHISFYEADAFANWSGKRLLTEFEWEAAAQVFAPTEGHFASSGRYEPTAANKNVNGIHQMLGDVWEWTYSSYHPYPGFSKAPGALGEYNGKFMINQMVLRGGSCATPDGHARTTYRNFFHPDKRWQFSGIRLATS